MVEFYFPLFLGMVMYDNEFKTKENKISTKDKIEPQHIFNNKYTVTNQHHTKAVTPAETIPFCKIDENHKKKHLKEIELQ